MPLSPPLCLEAYFQTTNVSGNDYTTTLTVTPQTYQSGGAQASYTGSNVAVGMYATSSLYGYVFLIKSITSQTSTSVVAVLEDLNGTNKSIDPSGGPDGGGPLTGRGYIFELNEDGLPALTAINNAPTITFPDSILGRFCYDQKPPLNERLLVAVGQGTNTIATSQDGLNWIRRTSPFTTAAYDVAWNGSLWVAVGQGTHTIATSPDGITWTGRGASIFTTLGHGVAWNGSIWVAVGQGTHTIATSPDGITWTGRGATIFTTLGRRVAWNGSLWVAVGAGTNSIATSADGINWVGRGLTIFTGRGYSVAWNGSLWVAVGQGTNNIATSPDGITWTGRGTPVFSTGGGGFGIAWNGSLWVAVGAAGTDSIATSPDGITWTGRGATAFSSGGYSVAWNGSLWVAVGQGTNTIATSVDGITWTGRGASIFTSVGNYVASRRVLPYVGTVTTIPKTYPTLQVYARGAGNKNPLARLVVLNGTPLSSISNSRGLTLTIINAIDLSVVSSTNYDTWGSLTDANNLGTAINNMTRQQIGILTSSDAWEAQAINSTTLQNAASRVGLTKLGEFILSGPVNRPYAAIFSGAGTDTTNVGTHDVIERMESDDADAPPASASAYIISDGTYASISGANSTNALYSANSSTKDAIVYVNSSGNMGVGTTATSLVSRLQVNDRVTDDNSFNYGSAPLSVTIPTATSTTVLNDQLPVAHFLRQGTGGQAYGARATMALSRYENSGVNSRTRLDFQLAHTTFDTVNVMSLRSDGNVGIGTVSPLSLLHIGKGTYSTPSNGADGTSFGITFGSSNFTEQARILCVDHTNIPGVWNGVLAFHTASNTGGGTNIVERMRINGAGNVGINTTLPSERFDVNGIISNRGGSTQNTNGFVALVQGSSTNTGYMNFMAAGGVTRRGFIGAATSSETNIYGEFGVDVVVSAHAAERLRATSTGVTVTGTFNKIPANEGYYENMNSRGSSSTAAIFASATNIGNFTTLVTYTTGSATFGDTWTINQTGYYSFNMTYSGVNNQWTALMKVPFQSTIITLSATVPAVSTNRLWYEYRGPQENTFSGVYYLTSGTLIKLYASGTYGTNCNFRISCVGLV